MNDKEDIPSLVGRLSREHWEKVLVAPAVAAERERCAQVCDKIAEHEEGRGAREAAYQIRKGE